MQRLPFCCVVVCLTALGCAREAPPQSSPAPMAAEAADAAAPAERSPLPDRDVGLAKTLIAEKNAVVLDVRTQSEWDAARYDGAILIPHDALESRIQEVRDAAGGDKDRPVVIFCRSGGRAGVAREVLERDGFTQVTNVGGLVDLCPDCMQPETP